jgi:hypothetical protein
MHLYHCEIHKVPAKFASKLPTSIIIKDTLEQSPNYNLDYLP